MSNLEDKAEAVAGWRKEVLQSLGAGFERGPALVDALIAAVRRHDVEIVREESLRDDTGTDAEVAYNQAIGDASKALEAHAERDIGEESTAE